MTAAFWGILAALILLPLCVNAQPQPPAAQPQSSPPPPTPPAAPQTKEFVIRPGGIPGVAPEFQEAARKARRAREKVSICQKKATDDKIMPRERTKFVLDCVDRLAD